LTRKHDDRHLTARRIQAFLDGRLPEKEAGTVREHAESCARCGTDLEAWRLLFDELSELDRLEPSAELAAGVLLGIRTKADERLEAALEQLGRHAPSPGFAARVMAGLEEPAGTAARIPDAKVEALLAGLGHYEPSPAFAARVMSQLRIGALVREQKRRPVAAAARSVVSVARDAWTALDRIVPKTRGAWAVIGGVAVTPVSIIALVAWTIFSNPLATPANLARFAWWQTSTFLGSLAASFGDIVFESPVITLLYAAAESLSPTPVVAVVGAVSFGLLTFGALWILYRNLLLTRSVDTRYARAAA